MTSNHNGDGAPDDDSAFEAGMRMRRRIHGAEHVDRSWSAARADAQKHALQHLITEAAWGRVWTRDGLPLKFRSMLAIAFLSALGRPHELEVHIRSAILRNDCTVAEVKEIIIQAAIYCGVPAAVDAFALAEKVDKEIAARA